MKIAALKPLITAISENDAVAMLSAIDNLRLRGDCGPAWHINLDKLASVINTGKPMFSILALAGNSKLPFISFSALPGRLFCPGAGACLDHCYSFKAWRYPAAFARQAQNTILLNSVNGQAYIQAAIDKALSSAKYRGVIAAGKKIDFRLYVDGDFRHLADMTFWFNALNSDAGKALAVYGYSKSFAVFLEYQDTGKAFPSNYLLNISSGHNSDRETVLKIEALPCTRGHFKTVKMPYKVNSSMHSTRGHQSNLRAEYGSKAFTCAGKCGTCTNAGHACGSKRFNSIDIIIAVH